VWAWNWIEGVSMGQRRRASAMFGPFVVQACSARASARRTRVVDGRQLAHRDQRSASGPVVPKSARRSGRGRVCSERDAVWGGFFPAVSDGALTVDPRALHDTHSGYEVVHQSRQLSQASRSTEGVENLVTTIPGSQRRSALYEPREAAGAENRDRDSGVLLQPLAPALPSTQGHRLAYRGEFGERSLDGRPGASEVSGQEARKHTPHRPTLGPRTSEHQHRNRGRSTAAGTERRPARTE